MGRYLHRYSFYALILAVYGVFFSVQSFYNFEGHSDAREIIRYSCSLHAVSAEGGAKTAALSVPGSHKAKVRLNKRFHQEEFSPGPLYAVRAPFIPAIPRELPSFVPGALPAVTLVEPQLRGPPDVA